MIVRLPTWGGVFYYRLYEIMMSHQIQKLILENPGKFFYCFPSISEGIAYDF